MKSWLLCLFIFLSFGSGAGASEAESESEKPVHLMAAVGSEFRPEKDVNNNYAQHYLSNTALGFGYEKFLFLLERATFSESSGNATLAVARDWEDTLLWVQWHSSSWYRLSPFVTGGAGAYKEKVTTDLLGVSTVNESSLKILTGLGFGFRLNVPYLWVSLEARMLFGDELDLQPSLGGLARVGIWF